MWHICSLYGWHVCTLQAPLLLQPRATRGPRLRRCCQRRGEGRPASAQACRTAAQGVAARELGAPAARETRCCRTRAPTGGCQEACWWRWCRRRRYKYRRWIGREGQETIAGGAGGTTVAMLHRGLVLAWCVALCTGSRCWQGDSDTIGHWHDQCCSLPLAMNA